MTLTLLHNATLIDGNGEPPVPDAALLIDGERITAVGPLSSLDIPRETQRIDLNSATLLPGLIDTHVHVMLQEINIGQMLATPFSLRFYQSTHYLRNLLEAGITSVRDAGGADLGVKQAIESGLISGPRMQISISVLGITGGHIDFWMPSDTHINLFPPYPGFPDGICDGVAEVRKKVREVLRAGADVVKICATGGVMSPTDHPEFTQFSMAELEAIVEEARFRKGIKVMAHAQGAEGIKQAVRAGIHSIEHGIYLDDEAIELMLSHGTYLVPTLLAPLYVLEAGQEKGMPAHAIRKSEEVFEIHSESISKAHKAGVKIAMGTDSGVMPHGTNLRELGLMVAVGMSPMEALVATTRTAAECMGWEDKLGTLEVGKLADVVVAGCDPLADIRELEKSENIQMVFKGGELVVDKRPKA